jgi:hypothetical protein
MRKTLLIASALAAMSTTTAAVAQSVTLTPNTFYAGAAQVAWNSNDRNLAVGSGQPIPSVWLDYSADDPWTLTIDQADQDVLTAHGLTMEACLPTQFGCDRILFDSHNPVQVPAAWLLYGFLRMAEAIVTFTHTGTDESVLTGAPLNVTVTSTNTNTGEQASAQVPVIVVPRFGYGNDYIESVMIGQPFTSSIRVDPPDALTLGCNTPEGCYWRYQTLWTNGSTGEIGDPHLHVTADLANMTLTATPDVCATTNVNFIFGGVESRSSPSLACDQFSCIPNAFVGSWDFIYLQVGEPNIDCSHANASPSPLWPPDHKMANASIGGVNNHCGKPANVTPWFVLQSQPVTGDGTQGPGQTGADAVIVNNQLSVRADRLGNDKNGRIYFVYFDAFGSLGSDCAVGADGSLWEPAQICVPHDAGGTCVDNGQRYWSMGP